MRKIFKHFGLFILTMLPIASVAFAAQSALNSAQIRDKNVSMAELQDNPQVSWTSGSSKGG